MEIAAPARRKIVKNYESNQNRLFSSVIWLPDHLTSTLFMIQCKRQSVAAFSIDSNEAGCNLRLAHFQYFYSLIKFKNVTNGTSQLSQTQLPLLTGLMVLCCHTGD